ncbi:T-complex protein 1 subunit gamma [Gossypium australe]|uniref:T-complex protein 1 subunit gamma n=1 Tax=Gossypium australe TaxID=47621 RepID=A0A5B6VQB0_9ROSI|nr:T-complex protein 1 subunit gamma [Gossypium australe]
MKNTFSIKRMISVVNDNAEFDKRLDKIEEKARVSTDEAIGSRNEDNKLSLGIWFYGFEVGDMVWGKVKSHPWWPGHIFNEAFASSSVIACMKYFCIVVTNDGNAILRELDLAHPAAKSMIELSRTQDEEFGDGATSIIVLAGEMLHVPEAFIEKNYHLTVICRGNVT